VKAFTLAMLLVGAGCSGCAFLGLSGNACRVDAPKGVAANLRDADQVKADLEEGRLTPEKALKRYEEFLGGAELSFPAYLHEECGE